MEHEGDRAERQSLDGMDKFTFDTYGLRLQNSLEAADSSFRLNPDSPGLKEWRESLGASMQVFRIAQSAVEAGVCELT